MNINVYYNDEYSPTTHDVETFGKAQHIARGLRQIPEVSEWVKVKDPADTPGALARAQKLIESGLTAEYLRALMTGEPRHLAESNGYIWTDGVYTSILNSTAGIVCAVDDVTTKGFRNSCSLSSGLHHARPNEGYFLCAVNSLAIGAMYAASKGRRVAVLDLDAHFGGGTHEYAKTAQHPFSIVDYSTSSLDSYEPDPSIATTRLIDSEDYLSYMDEALDALADSGPEIVFYNAGVDIYPMVSPDDVVARELKVAEAIGRMGAKTVIVMAGGYGTYEEIVPLHTATIMAFSRKEMLKAGPRALPAE
jgi:acetoin utilization deacetylase AcuC-like enzyme